MVADSDLLADYGDGCSLAQQNFGFPQLVDDLFRCVTFLGHLFPPFYEIITGIVLGGQVTMILSI
jgi:hypothetical protein